jgi:hypothetical protein
MSYMFLHRAHLPVLGPQQNGNGADETPNTYNEHHDRWRTWQKTSRKELLNEATMVLEMLEEMRTFGVFFLRGLVPWIGFTIYTAVGVMLYCFNFPSGEDDPRMREKARACVINGCTFLKEMKTQWPMAETWFETIKRMQVYYRSVLGQESPASPEERQALRRAMIDYGALQPSPVQKPNEASKAPDSSVVVTSLSPPDSTHLVRSPSILHLLAGTETTQNKPFTAMMRNSAMMSPPATTPTQHGYSSNMSWASPNTVPPLEADETFNLDSFDMSNAELEDMMINATQEFWASFPGEVGVGY